MKDIELQKVRENLRDIIQNKKIHDNFLEGASQEFNQLQEAFYYISQCISDTQGYITNVAKGNLDTEPPTKDNFLAGASKELQSVLRHLTWQTKQVAKGDYRQRIDFLGEFSDSFNVMIGQLNERKEQLLENERVMSQTMDLMISIMNANNGWVLVTDKEVGNIHYKNRELDPGMLGGESFDEESKMIPTLLEYAKEQKEEGQVSFTYRNESCFRHYAVNSHEVIWDHVECNAYYILDVTHHEEEKKNLSELAFVDELTKAYNRRYGMNAIQRLLDEKEEFALVMVDLNDLKAVNDNGGHSCGDDYIRTTCDIIRDKVRERDLLIRVGGDEFIVVLQQCSDEGAQNKLALIANAVEKEEKGFHMSISYGIVCNDTNEKVELSDMLEVADNKMYEFKKVYKARKRMQEKEGNK